MEELIQAHVVSAASLKEDQALKLKNILEKKTGNQIELTNSVDPSLIGGFTLRAGGMMMDYTVKSQLEEMREINSR